MDSLRRWLPIAVSTTLMCAIVVGADALHLTGKHDHEPIRPRQAWCDVIRVIDGDTFVADVLLPLDVTLRQQRIRLYGVDAPELREERGPEARDRLEHWLRLQPNVLVELHGRDNFGRVLARVMVGGKDVGDILRQEGLAR